MDDAAPDADADSGMMSETAPPSDAGLPDTHVEVDATPPFDCTARAVDAGDAGDAGPAFPEQLYCTGLYSDWGAKTVSPGILPFNAGVALWSDGAIKSRWISLPAGSKIDTTDMDEWKFPIGTRLFKEFKLGAQRIETRLFEKLASTGADSDWRFTVYRWSADGSSAPKMETGELNVNGTGYGAGAESTPLHMRLTMAQVYALDAGVGSTGTVVNTDTCSPDRAGYLHRRDEARDPSDAGVTQMPPLITHRPDDAGVILVSDWITAVN